MAAPRWDNEKIRGDFRRLWEANMADASGQAQRRLQAKAAGRLPVAYETNHDEASAKAYVYGHTSDAFQSREQLLAELRSFRDQCPPPEGGDASDRPLFFEHVRFKHALIATVDGLIAEYAESPLDNPVP